MAYLGKYIRQILSKQEPVILPGFGSLVSTEGKGVAGPEGRIDPPGTVIRFDATHPKGDGKLAEEYAKGEQMDLEEARQQVLELVDAIKFKLDKGEKYELASVGTFTRDDDNKIHFRKDPNWVIDPDEFGLSSLELLELEDEPEQPTEIPEPVGVTAPVVSSIPEELKEKKAETIQQKPPEPPPRIERSHVNKWRIIWIVVGSLIAVLALILLIPTENGIEFGRDGIVIRERDSENELTPSDTDLDESRIERETSGSGDAEEKQEEDRPVSPPVQENKYFIIAGSFQSLPNANELMNDLKASGFPAEIIITENRLYRVSVKSFATKEEALRELPGIKNEPGLSTAWLMAR